MAARAGMLLVFKFGQVNVNL